MADNWLDEVRRYAPDADLGIVAGIVRYCGIGLRTDGAARVDFADPVETVRVRDHFCRNKLRLTEPDATVDAAIGEVRTRMGNPAAGDRVAVYYLLAERFGKLGLFAGAAAASPAAAAGIPRRVAVTPDAARVRPRDSTTPTALLGCGALAVIVIATAAAAIFFGHPLSAGEGVPASVAVANGPPPVYPLPAAGAMPATAATPAAGPAIPQGAGVLASTVAGRPQVSVYFATAKADIAPDFATAVAPVKAYLDAHAGARLHVSGYNDPRGDAAFNAALSKRRAQAVAAALTKLGVTSGVIDLVKPADTTDATTTQAEARRVDVTVADAR